MGIKLVVNDKASEAKTADSLNIWNIVKKTDHAFVRPMVMANGWTLSTINHNYQIHRATELFGPCGLGWGYDITKEEVIQGPALYKDLPASGNHSLHVLQIKLWYKSNGQRGEVSHYGQTTLTSLDTAGNVKMDENAPKKSLTDAIGKCLSMLGFSADIYSGQYDGEVKPASKVIAVEIVLTELSVKLTACKTLTELQTVWTSITVADRADPANKQAKDAAKLRLNKH